MWAEVQKAALEASYKPEDLTEDEKLQWSSHKRLAYAKTIASLYRTLVEGLTSKQEGERRAYGFDYKLQQEAAPSTGRTWKRSVRTSWPSTSSWTTSSAKQDWSSTETPAQGRMPTEQHQRKAGRLLRPAGQGPAALH